MLPQGSLVPADTISTERIAEAVSKLLSDRAARDLMTLEFDAIIAKLGESGASEKAARTIIEELT